MQLVGSAPGCYPEEKEVGLLTGRLLFAPFPGTRTFLSLLWGRVGVEGGVVDVSEPGNVVSVGISKWLLQEMALQWESQGLQPQECLVPAPMLWLAAWEIPARES